MKVAEENSCKEIAKAQRLTKKLQLISTPDLHTGDKVPGKGLTVLSLFQVLPSIFSNDIYYLFFTTKSFGIIFFMILKLAKSQENVVPHHPGTGVLKCLFF